MKELLVISLNNLDCDIVKGKQYIAFFSWRNEEYWVLNDFGSLISLNKSNFKIIGSN